MEVPPGLLFNLPPVSFKKFLHFSFKTVENFLPFKTLIPRAKEVRRKPDPQAVRTCESRGSPGGWSGLEVTDILYIVGKRIYRKTVFRYLNNISISRLGDSVNVNFLARYLNFAKIRAKQISRNFLKSRK